MRGDSGVAGEGRVAGIPKFHSWGTYTMRFKYQLRLDVQRFLWPVYYLYYIILSSKVIAPQDAHKQ